MSERWRACRIVSFLVTAILAGCTAYAVPPPAARPADIPPGHMPPRGECRIWFPDRPPGQQPPPGPCHILRHQVPHGARLVYG